MRIENQLLVTKTGRMAATTVKPKKASNGVLTPPLFSSADMELPLEGDPSTVFQLHPDEPNLYQIPSNLSPVYGTLPVLLQACVWLIAALSSALMTWKQRLTWASPLVAIAKKEVNFMKLLSFFVKSWIFATLSNGLLQEVLTPPTRVSVGELRNNYILPSTLSRFEDVPIQLEKTKNLGVHYLQYQSKSQPPARFQALYVNHGFGASSLSWLPALPKMVDRLQVRVGVGHDAVGFGFTDRPKDLEAFTTTASAAIGMALLEQQIQQKEEEGEEDSKPVILMGHSMGSLATLQMALAMPATTKKCVVLVAPALGMRPSSHRKSLESKRKRLKNPLFLQKAIGKAGTGASLIGKYGLRRLVGYVPKNVLWKGED
jgi:predicted esterase